VHRYTLSSHQVITPGDVNLMTAGSGIAHSERTGQKERTHPHSLFGLQCWLGLPSAKEEIAPAFKHHNITELPFEESDGVSLRVVAGEIHTIKSPVNTVSDTLFVDVTLNAGSTFLIPNNTEERAVHIVSGNVMIGDLTYNTAHMLILQPGKPITIKAQDAARVIILGGATLDGPRHLWWNFVSSSKDRIEQAKQDWLDGKFGKIPGDEEEFIPLP